MAPRDQQEFLLKGTGPEQDDERTHQSSRDVPLLAACRHLLKPNGSICGLDVAEAILPKFRTFCSAIPTMENGQHQPQPALASIDGRMPLTHDRIQHFCVHEFGPMLHALGFGKGNRIALVLPNGPELALAIVATAHWASCVPLSANGALSELEADLMRCGADLVVGPYGGPLLRESDVTDARQDARFCVMSSNKEQDWSAFRSIEESAAKLNIPFVGLVPSPNEAGTFRLQVTQSVEPLAFEHVKVPTSTPFPTCQKGPISTEPNNASDEVLVLFTSGTTGNKKLVPHLMDAMLVAAATISLSWDLTRNDVNCNLMPLFHVGGIVRQVFSPILSGGCVICCPSFDPSIFWALLEKREFTWYYASPTMHQLILQTGRDDGFVLDDGRCNYKLRMIANAAGGLLPSLAKEMLKAFDSNILPSYGMSECMPISSPPATYRLEKPGTSGVPVGPEVAILNTATLKEFPVGEEGPICVRGYPCFRGYGKIANEISSQLPNNDAFLEGGWFNTGDLGRMDSDGYLYITGRSKEVINRGGEIISPMEVEEAVSAHADVATCAAFSALHSILQEVVGIVIVMKKGKPRLDLASLHEFLGDRLAAPKWPHCLVFMDGLPKSHTNKLLRVKLGSRLGLPEMNDEMSMVERTFEATCPTQGTPLDVPIVCQHVSCTAADIQCKLMPLLMHCEDQNLRVVNHPSRAGAFVCYLVQIERKKAVEISLAVLDRYFVPTHFVETSESTLASRELPPPRMADATTTIIQGGPSEHNDPVIAAVQELFTRMLNLDFYPGADANFFHLGGSSMLASQLASKIRREFAIACSGSEVFQHSSPSKIARLIRQKSDHYTDSTASVSSGSQGSWKEKDIYDQGVPFGAERLAPQNTWLAALVQLTPMFLVFPIWQITRYLLFFSLLLYSIANVPGDRDIGRFVIAYLAFHAMWVTMAPLVFVAIKWIVIGRYKPGRYPIWGSYYLRWWFVDICRKLFLRGVWGSHDFLLNTYYRLLGAKIGSGARISLECDLAEFDLVEVGDGAAVEMCNLRGFGVDNGAMILGPVKVGQSASVGVRSVVAPYTSIEAHGHLGAATSSYEVGKALDAKHARVNRQLLSKPNFWMEICIVGPITFLVNAFGQIPPLAVLFLMLQYKGAHDVNFETLGDLMAWLCDPHRIQYYIGIRVARALLTPFFYMTAAIFVKKILIGKFKPGPRDTQNQWQLLRHALAASLFSRKKVQNVTDLIGRHYELVSCLYRLLGAKVGKRVFWPGRQPIFTGEFDLLEIGDDVVFGSRSSIFFTTAASCEKVVLCAGSNVADNCVVFPGSILGKNAVLGSNSVCPEGWYLPEQSVWLGSKGGEPTCLEKGSEFTSTTSHADTPALVMSGDSSTLRPFGRAFYFKKAPYFVWSLELIITFTLFCKAFIAAFHTLPLLGAIHGAAAILYGWSMHERDYLGKQYHFLTVYLTMLAVYIVTNFCRILLWLVIELTAKWTLMGKRKEGRYNYDTTSYAQRWELYQTIAKIRKFSRLNFLDFFSGTPFLTAYFRWNGGTIGNNCCLYPAGADPFMPEPDLVQIGDNCIVDGSAMVCHLNTRGNFELAKIVLEKDCTLRSRSRVQQAVYMEEGSQLLEKSLALTGEVIEAYSVWQGSPASCWFKYDKEKEEQFYDETSKLLQSNTSFYV